MKINCLLSPADIHALTPARLAGRTCVVFDVLRATSTMVTALSHGTREIFPACSIEEAWALREERPDAKLAGERLGDRIEGFDYGNSPLEFLRDAPERLITTTTNGTIALRACAAAEAVVAASLLNLAAVAAWLGSRNHPDVLLVCAGTGDSAALEDIFAAGALIDRLPDGQLSDAAGVAVSTHLRWKGEAVRALHTARNGRALRERRREAEVEFCARCDVFSVVPQLRDGRLTSWVGNVETAA